MKKHLSPKLKVKIKLFIRFLTDLFSGDHFKFAHTFYPQHNFNYSISLIQPIKRNTTYENKMENIRVTSSKIQNIIINPNQVFSFWKTVGEATLANGFKKGRNIVAGELSEGIGGGLCQVSSILYHLSLLGGLKIKERFNHTIDIYKEEDRFTPLGADATVVYGHKDLRVSNPYSFPISFSLEVKEEEIKAFIYSKEKISQAAVEFERIDSDKTRDVLTYNDQEIIIGKSHYIKPS